MQQSNQSFKLQVCRLQKIDILFFAEAGLIRL